ncbi:MAG TPA: hypothetical protein VN457_06805, partial [Chlamydiales bacterium]|nr:hypothetical protein [Chlamydiales bacterium]
MSLSSLSLPEVSTNSSSSSSSSAARLGVGLRGNLPIVGPAATHPILMRIEAVTKPRLTGLLPVAMTRSEGMHQHKKSYKLLTALHREIHGLYKQYGEAFGKGAEGNGIGKIQGLHFARYRLTPDGAKAVEATIQLLQELAKGQYSAQSALDYASSACSLVLHHLEGGATGAQTQVDALCKRALDGTDGDVVVT